MAKAPPSFDFFFNDWKAGTAHLTHVERACYLDLLIFQWQNGHIPRRKQSMMALCGIHDQGQWDSIWEAIRDKFELVQVGEQEADTAYANPRMLHDRETAVEKYQQMVARNRENGRKNGSPKRVEPSQFKPTGYPSGSPVGEPLGSHMDTQKASQNGPTSEEGRGKEEEGIRKEEEGTRNSGDPFAPPPEWTADEKRWWATWLTSWRSKNRGQEPDPNVVSSWRTKLLGQPGHVVGILEFSCERNAGRLEVDWYLDLQAKKKRPAPAAPGAGLTLGQQIAARLEAKQGVKR